jgi:putative aldouronate transport system permease protein
MRSSYRRKTSDVVLDVLIYAGLILLALTTIIPFMQVISISLSPSEVTSSYGLHLFPRKITLEGYRSVLSHNLIWRSYANTIITTVGGTALSVIILVLGAYPLAKSYLPNRRFWTAFFVFTMYFQGGIVPTFILVNGVGIRDTLWALILPRAAYAFNLIIVRNFFMAIPQEIEESATIDGAKDVAILFRIVIPLSLPVIATVTLWKGVYQWNQWFDCMIYIESQTRFILQYVLRLILIEGQQEYMSSSTVEYVSADTMKMATLVVATLPIIATYPFLQKYFVKGALIGAVKG